MSYLKPQVNFSLKFASLFSVMRGTSSVHFLLKLYIIWTKGVHQSAKFQTFDCSLEISPNFYFDKLYQMSAKFQLKKYRGLCLVTLKYDTKFVEKLTYGLKNDMKNLTDFCQTT